MRCVVIVSANTEWRAVREIFPYQKCRTTPYGEYFTIRLQSSGRRISVPVMHGGWGKTSAAASCQYAIDRWKPSLVMNLGTCGGFKGEVEEGEILLIEKTVIYDIIEQMSDPEEAIESYSTILDLNWLKPPFPLTVRRSLIVSADRDLVASEVESLKSKYQAIAGDWESGSIAWVASKNRTRCLILRGVTDLVDATGNPAYGDISYYRQKARGIMATLFETLEGWIEKEILHNPILF